MGRFTDGHEHHRVEIELGVRLLRAGEMTEMRGVERPAEDADAQRYSLTWPDPSATNL